MAMLTKMQQDMEEAAATKDAAHEIAVERLARDIDVAHAYDREVFATSMKRCRERELHAAALTAVLEQSKLSSEYVKGLQQEQRRNQLEKSWSDKSITAEMSSKER